ncbi:MAG: polymer-forming cytoskeletal protein [Chitinophagales bacterium]|nr:polymer-forming cytoskeletal protein [Chitinophagaceae bacterium]MCB9064007.1 polymer-forming cytoskeletal protein [Chitinophagales bacterium]
MFIKKDGDKNNTPSKVSGTVTTIAAGTTINGDMESDTNLRIDGNIIGNVYCKAKIVLGESGIIQGDVQSANADVFGTINGNVVANDLVCLKAKSVVNGNINTKRLQIEPNATFNGQCKMTSEGAAAKPAKSDKKAAAPELVHEN